MKDESTSSGNDASKQVVSRDGSELRRKAETYLANLAKRGGEQSVQDISELIEELTVHQIELEMQGQELRESSDQLRAATDKYQQYFLHAPIPILRTNRFGAITEFNLRARDSFFPQEKLAGPRSTVKFEQTMDAVSRGIWHQFHDKLGRNMESATAAISLLDGDGKARFYSLTGQQISPGENVIYFEDITKLSESAKESERLSLIASHTGSLVIFTDAQRKITWVNRAFEEFTGYSHDEVLGKNPSFLQGEHTDQDAVERMRIAMSEERSFVEHVLNYTKSGREYWIKLEVMPIRSETGQLTGYFGVSSDVSEIRTRELQLGTFRSAIEQSPATVVITDTDGNIEYTNPAFTKITGYTKEEAIGQNPRILQSGDQPKEFYEKLWRTVLSGKQWEGIFRNRKKDGSLYWEFATIAPVLDARGRASKFIAVKVDITEQMDSRNSLESLASQLQRTQLHLDQTNELALIGSWECDLVTNQLIHSKMTRCIHEVPEDRQLTVEEAIEFYVGESRVKIEEAVHKLINEGKTFDMECEFRTGKGNLRWVRSVGLGEFVDGRCIRIYGTFQDITAQKALQQQLESALEEEHRQLRFIKDLTESLPVGIIQKDRDCRIVEANSAAATLTGFAREELLEMTILERYGEAMEAEILEEDAKLITGETEFIQTERVIRRKDGSHLHVLVTKAPIHDTAENIIGLVIAFMDISAMKNLEEDLRKASRESDSANRAKSAFLATMSHEIRTPLNAVIGMASLLAESELNHEQKDYAHTIVTASETLLDLISDILDYSKIESQKLHLESRSFVFEDVFLEPLELFNQAAAEKGIEISHWIDPQIPQSLVGDRARIKQVLINLLGNAVKFTPEGQISLTAKLEEKSEGSCRISFEVRDTGIGISDEAQQHLFQPFSQADSSITRQYGGSGLGLAISRQLINLMGGDISVASTAGKGASFRFDIRLELPTEELISRQTAEDLRGKRMLVIDDVAVNRKLVRSYCHKWGIEVMEADGAEQARSVVAQSRAFDCIIFDYAMPGTDGATLAQEFSAMPGIRDVPRVLLSSIGDLTQDLPAHLFDRVLTKPIRPSRLLEILSELLAERFTPAPPTDREKFPDLSVLLAEDNPNNRVVLRLMLKKCGIDPAVTEDGAEAVARAAEQEYDVVILDVQMPVMDGLTAVKQLRSRYKNSAKRPFFIALTANAFKEDEIRCLEAGFDRYCSKPVTIDRLREVLAEGASRKKAG